jgi:sigma-B regulation protein RsbU (phosphoserine phosphatase)
MEGIRYRVNELQMNCGDRIFLYTDGVTEATNTDNVLYGEDRLFEYMNSNKDVEAMQLLPLLKADIDSFVGTAPQFDDITMLMLDYKSGKEGESMTEKSFPAKTAALNDVLGFVEETLESFECPMKTQMAICVAIEEVFVNVAHYAYGDGEGDMTLGIGFDAGSREITFRMTDKGTPFDPLKKPDPDITLSAEDREIGGLGIFITKKTMDTVTYAYENGENILTMIKKI